VGVLEVTYFNDPGCPWGYSISPVTQEVAAVMAQANNPPDRAAAERALVELVGAGGARRTALGNDALWRVA
jgi:protein-disulfide isomerase-like protein with CxxC motif